MNWSELDTWIVVTGVLISMACALPGLFLLLNKQSMLGDAISHAVLPGIAIAFLVSGSRDVLPMILGAAAAGLLTGLLTQVIHLHGRVDSGAAMGVVFCSLFALGLVLIRLASDRVDLDPGCVLYGAIETAVIDTGAVPAIAIQSGVMFAANLLLVVCFYKELRIAAFDPALATTMGINAHWMRQALTVATAVTTVIAFESVGSILVIAMLIVPAATAMLLSRKLGHVLALSLVIAGAAAAIGHVSAISVMPWAVSGLTGVAGIGAVSSAGMMAAASGAIFLAALLASRMQVRRGSAVESSSREAVQAPAG